MLQDVVAGAEPQQILLLQPAVGEILRILQPGSGIRKGIVINHDADGNEMVHLLNQVDEADLLQLMDKEEAAKYLESTEPTEPEPVMVTPKPEEKEQSNLLPLIGVLLIACIGGGVFFLMKAKGKQKNAAKPDSDADYIDDDEDFGYVEEEAEELDFTDDSVDAEHA